MDVIAYIAGVIGLLVGMWGYTQKDDTRLILMTVLSNSFLYCTTFSWMGNRLASAFALLLVVIRMSLSLYSRHIAWFYFFSALAVMQWVIYGEPVEVLVVLATILSNYAYFMAKGIAMRLWLLGTMVCWLPVSFYFAAWPSLFYTVLILCVNVHTILTMHRNEKENHALR